MSLHQHELGPRLKPESEIPESVVKQCDELVALIDESVLVPEEDREEFNSNLSRVLESIGSALLDHAATDPNNDPSLVTHRILEAYRAIPNEANQLESKILPDLNRAVSKYPPNLGRVRELDLSPYDEMSLLKASALAGIVRGTVEGAKLANTAICVLRHEITNIINSGLSRGRIETGRFLVAWQRVVFANQALQELGAREGSNEFTTVDDNLLLWSNLAQRPAEEDVMTPHIEDMDDLVQFRKLTDFEQEERLKGLFVIGNRVKEIFGDCDVTYFETIVFDGDPQPTIKDDESTSQEEIEDPEDDESDDITNTGALFKDYIIANIVQRLPDGSEVQHIVAESIHYRNACYVLRGDLLAEVSQLIGREVSWKDVYGGRKNTARQMGAKDFRHAQNTDLPGRVLKYLGSELPSLLHGLSLKWTDSAKKIYESDMSPTRWNRLPLVDRRNIEGDKTRVRKVLEHWKTLGGFSAVERHIGRITSLESDDLIPDQHTSSDAKLKAENELLLQQLEVSNARILELEGTLRALRAVLGP